MVSFFYAKVLIRVFLRWLNALFAALISMILNEL